ncbi:MAG TPA: IS200/IS605 family transposase [Bacteroidales bacterium]|nr:IS200/IS605 family transposase [Bacteroidales bacterium]
MANTYTRIYLHLVFTPGGRENIIPVKYHVELQKFTTGIIQNNRHKLLAIKFMPDHVHIFIGYQPHQALPDLMRDIKANTSRFINDKKWLPGKFQWQEGYGAFSYSQSQITNVIRYINNQENHHKRISFRDEYLKILERFEVESEPEYLFEWL